MGCGVPCPSTWRFCRACGGDFSAAAELDQHLFVPAPPGVASIPAGAGTDDIPVPSPRKKSWSLIEYCIFFAIIGILAAIALPNQPRGSRDRARERACYANMRVILGAVEMYNMDHSVMIDRIGDADVGPHGILVRGQYLKSGISKPETKCSYDTIGKLTGDGKIVCATHGTVEE